MTDQNKPWQQKDKNQQNPKNQGGQGGFGGGQGGGQGGGAGAGQGKYDPNKLRQDQNKEGGGNKGNR